MKLYSFFLTFLLFSCINSYTSVDEEYKEIKKDVLYVDKYNNIFLKSKIYIKNQKDISKPETRYFDLGVLGDSIVKLKDVIDVFSFSKIASDTFVDKYNSYVVNSHPATFPNIIIVKNPVFPKEFQDKKPFTKNNENFSDWEQMEDE